MPLGHRTIVHEVSMSQHAIEPAFKDVGSYRRNYDTWVQDVSKEALIVCALFEPHLKVQEDLEATVYRPGCYHIHVQRVVYNVQGEVVEVLPAKSGLTRLKGKEGLRKKRISISSLNEPETLTACVIAKCWKPNRKIITRNLNIFPLMPAQN